MASNTDEFPGRPRIGFPNSNSKLCRARGKRKSSSIAGEVKKERVRDRWVILEDLEGMSRKGLSWVRNKMSRS